MKTKGNFWLTCCPTIPSKRQWSFVGGQWLFCFSCLRGFRLWSVVVLKYACTGRGYRKAQFTSVSLDKCSTLVSEAEYLTGSR